MTVNWNDAKRRVLGSYRAWIRSRRLQAPEIQTMYSLGFPISELRTKMRSEFERHRYVNHLGTVDKLLQHSNAEYQETMNYWKQLPHVLKYWRVEEDKNAKLPPNFITGFLECYRDTTRGYQSGFVTLYISQ
ncbi:hypothetical protein CJF31_00000156 [Rutstroemia sp. NJR-2017a BVV2]|nr:hypothetical protein CJF31_00000156 [Rutstroemia sp. NJR-2017a BVV2]